MFYLNILVYMSKSSELVAKAIKHFLKIHGISQADLARKFKLRPPVVNKFAAPANDYGISGLDKVSQWLNVNPHELLIDYESKSSGDSDEVTRGIYLLRRLDKSGLDAILPLLEQLCEPVQTQHKSK